LRRPTRSPNVCREVSLSERGLPHSHYISLLLSKFWRDFVILSGLRVMTPDRSALLPNRRLFGAGG
jgi:hypothetical protein